MGVFEDEIKQTKRFKTEQERAYVNIIYTGNRLQEQISTVFEPFQITHQQYNVLRILRGSHPKPTNNRYIKEVMLDRSPDVTRLCDRLEAKELVLRKINPDNRRETHIYITKQGLDLLDQIEPSMQGHLPAPYLTDAEAAELNRLLDKLRG